MGYFSLDFRKAKGASDSRMSDHIERRVIAPNVDPTRTHLNRELVRMPEGIRERDDAIAARISSAGIRRKITHDQVRAIRVMLSGTHEDMMEIEKAGRLDDWCRDSMDWLYRTFGRENVVSAVLHMDEHTPHIHATLVPIVTGERRKAGQKKPKEEGRTTARSECRPAVCRRRVEPYQTDCLSRRLCQSHGEIRPATRDKRFGSPACLHRPVLPRFEAADGRTGRERAPTPSRAGRGGETAGNGQKGNQHAKAGGGQGGGKDRHHGEGGFSFGQWENQGAGGGQPQLAKRNSRP